MDCRCVGTHSVDDCKSSIDTEDVKILETSKCWRLCHDVKIKTEILDEIENFSADDELEIQSYTKPNKNMDLSIKEQIRGSTFLSVDHYEDRIDDPTMSRKLDTLITSKNGKHFNFNEYVAVLMNDKSLTCTVCRIEFPDEIKFKMHMISHSHGKVFQCRFCEKQFSRSSGLKQHYRVHNKLNRLECKHCHRRFQAKKDLNTHHTVAHSRNRSFECTVCNAQSLTLANMKLFECVVCKKKFLRSSSLRAHTIVHTADAPYECDVCSAKFKRSSVLKTHKLRHTGVRKFECDICKHRFHLKGALKHHILAHYGVRPYQCKDCGKRYRRSWGLKVHTYRHTGIKRFECDFCKSRFCVKTKLAKHIYGHIGEKPYKCDRCGRQYGERYLLKSHKCAVTKIADGTVEGTVQNLFLRSKPGKIVVLKY